MNIWAGTQFLQGPFWRSQLPWSDHNPLRCVVFTYTSGPMRKLLPVHCSPPWWPPASFTAHAARTEARRRRLVLLERYTNAAQDVILQGLKAGGHRR